MNLTQLVQRLALEAGFAAAGVAPADEPPPHADRFQSWLDRGWHADMDYLRENVDKRLRPDALVPGATSVICLAAAYQPVEEGIPRGEGVSPLRPASVPLAVSPSYPFRSPEQQDQGQDALGTQGQDALARQGPPLVARYARGRDYHTVLKKRCLRLMDRLREHVPGFEGRAFVDSAPVMERSLAARAALGWIGRNGCLIVPGRGSYVLLCEIVCNLPLAVRRDEGPAALESNGPLAPECGDCDACVKACPTGAIQGDGLVDARRCISYLTIECRGEIPAEHRPRMGGSLFGCDRCQEACPHNRLLPPGDAELAPSRPPLGGATPADILRWERDDWDRATRGSACRRATWEMFLRNAAVAAGNSRDPSLVPLLADLARRQPGLRDVCDWASSRLNSRTGP